LVKWGTDFGPTCLRFNERIVVHLLCDGLGQYVTKVAPRGKDSRLFGIPRWKSALVDARDVCGDARLGAFVLGVPIMIWFTERLLDVIVGLAPLLRAGLGGGSAHAA
jgi:hypothetical protein